ncbi:Protein phosphatase 2C 2 [Irineochytrium annulatum]|nr:Protein phosphatase 2C 2 [Irineochytrium annulatum]
MSAMEDAHTTLLDLLAETDPEANPRKRISFFSVYDGHGGATVAKYSGRNLHRYIAADEKFKAGSYKEAIKNGFLQTDQLLKNDPEYLSDPSGCTAVMTLVTDDWMLYCGNAGDSRAILSANGKAFPLSHDHKPLNPGNLALSRAIGDFEFKQNQNLPAERQIVTCDPDIIEKKIDLDEDEFMVIACDGIWDCMSNEAVVHFVRRGVANGLSLEKVAEDVMDKCLASDSELGGIGCDNMTIVIVAILGGKSVEEWTQKIKERYESSAGEPEVEPKEAPEET